MGKKKELFKNTVIIMLGKICTQFLSFFLMPLYTAKLSSSEYGVVDIISTYVVLITPVISLQLELALFRNLVDNRKNDNKKCEIISNALIHVMFQLIICLVIYLLINIFIYRIPYMNYILFYAIFTLFSSQFLQIARGLGDNIGYSISCVISGVSTILFNILFLVFLNFKVEGMLLAGILGNVLATIYLFFRCKLFKYFNIKLYDRKQGIELLKYSLPLVPNGLIWWVINVSDRTIIAAAISIGAAGIYAVSNKFSNILIQIYNVFNLSWTESASLHIGENDSFIRDTFNMILKLFLSVCILIILSIPFIFNIMVNIDYSEAYLYIPLLLIGMVFNVSVSFLGGIYIALKKTKEIAKTSLLSGVINIAINLLLIKYIGVYAAAVSTILAFLVMAVYRYLDVKKYINIELKWPSIIRMILLLIVAIINYYLFSLWLKLIISVVVLLLLIIFNKKDVETIFSYIIKVVKKYLFSQKRLNN